MPYLLSRFKGSLLGLALGDALGAPFEGSPPGDITLLNTLLDDPPDLLRYTDDTEMAIGVAESLSALGRFNADDMARRFAANCHPFRGYGPGALAVLGLIRQGTPWQEANRRVFPEGSYGNGAAMRAAPIGLAFAQDREKLAEVTRTASAITHAHPLGQEGALLITTAAACALQGLGANETLDTIDGMAWLPEYRAKLHTVRQYMDSEPSPAEVIRTLGNRVAAHESAPTALYAYLRCGSDYLETVSFCVCLGGDTDTISAMAGALAGASLGIDALPYKHLQRLEAREWIESLAERLHEKFS